MLIPSVRIFSTSRFSYKHSAQQYTWPTFNRAISLQRAESFSVWLLEPRKSLISNFQFTFGFQNSPLLQSLFIPKLQFGTCIEFLGKIDWDALEWNVRRKLPLFFGTDRVKGMNLYKVFSDMLFGKYFREPNRKI